MALTLYAHPFSSYCQKVLIALYGNGIAFDYQMLGAPDSPANLELAWRWPIRKFPLLVDGDQSVTEASIIMEEVNRCGGNAGHCHGQMTNTKRLAL